MNKPQHCFLMTFIVVHMINGAPALKYTNMTVIRPTKTVPLGAVRKAQDALYGQLLQSGKKPEEVIDLTLISISYMGLMTAKEFYAGLESEHLLGIEDTTTEETPATNPYTN